MEILTILGFVLFATMAVFGTVDLIRKINKTNEED